MKVNRIEITFTDVIQGLITCTRNANYQWDISGPIYPRHLKYLSMIDTLSKQLDENDPSSNDRKGK